MCSLLEKSFTVLGPKKQYCTPITIMSTEVKQKLKENRDCSSKFGEDKICKLK